MALPVRMTHREWAARRSGRYWARRSRLVQRGERASGVLTLGFAHQFVSAGTLDSEISTRVIEQRHGLFAHGAGCVHASDVQVVVAGRVNVNDRALEARDRGLQQRQPGWARQPGRAAQFASIGRGAARVRR